MSEFKRWVRRKGAQDMAIRARLILACKAVGEDGFPLSTAAADQTRSGRGGPHDIR